MRSLRRQLLLSLIGTFLALFVVVGLATYSTARAEIDQVMDYHLRQFALSLRDQSFGRPSAPIVAPEEAFDFVIQIWDGRGLRLYVSHPNTPLPEVAQFGYASVQTGDATWRVYSIPLLDRVIQVAQPMRVRSTLAARAALATLLPLLAILPLMAGLIWYLVSRGLRPLNRLAKSVRARRPDALQPLPDHGVPEEARPLVDALNGLLDRLDQALGAQRAFVADAAHELRTPLTALQLQLQLAERAEDPAERSAALAELRAGLARATHLVQQLLTLARQEPGGTAGNERTRIMLPDLVRTALTEYARIADARGIDLGATTLDEGAATRAEPAALRTLIGNLIDNAIRYTPAGGKVDVSTVIQDNRAWLEISDTGPGIPADERERVLDRFYRRPGQAEQGSGLGLAIVKTIADRHEAELLLEEAQGGGLRVRVGFDMAETRK